MDEEGPHIGTIAVRKERSSNKKKQKIKALKKQNWECSICRTPISDLGKAHWDHDHRTGRFRACLCINCNIGLGMFKDNPDLLIRASHYLMLHSK